MIKDIRTWSIQRLHEKPHTRFRTPSVMGFNQLYKSDYIWVTVQAPPKLWSEDLTQEVYTALAAYVTSECQEQ